MLWVMIQILFTLISYACSSLILCKFLKLYAFIHNELILTYLSFFLILLQCNYICFFTLMNGSLVRFPKTAVAIVCAVTRFCFITNASPVRKCVVASRQVAEGGLIYKSLTACTALQLVESV